MELELGTIQLRFAELVWENEPIPSGELVKLCETRFMWKKSTTYTVIKTLCEKGLIQNNNGIVSSIISREQFYSTKSEKFVDDTFQGSLPAFIAAFTTNKKLTTKDIDEIQKMIDQAKEEK